MNKITTLTAVGFAVLLILSVMPASAIKQVSSFESSGPIINATALWNDGGNITFNATELPMFYLDLDEVLFEASSVPPELGETLFIQLEAQDKTADEGIRYRSYAWDDENDNLNIAWLGYKYLCVGDNVEKLSKYLVDLESDEKITLKQGDVWDVGEKMTLTVQDIDVNGEQVWLALEQDGSSVDDIIVFANETEHYNTTVGGESDVTVVMIHVDKVFAGMSANMAIIDEAVIISMDVTELDDDKYFGMDFDSSPETYIELEEEDGKSLSRGKTLEIIPDFLSIRVGDTETDEPVRFYVYNEINKPGIYEQHGSIVNATLVNSTGPLANVTFNANQLPMFYLDIDEVRFEPSSVPPELGETLFIEFEAEDRTTDEGIRYRSYAWDDENDNLNIAWLGYKYLCVGDNVEKLSKYLVDLESDEKITLKQGDVWDVGEKMTLTVQDIDVNGEQVWLALEQDGSSVDDIIVFANETEYYNTTVGGESEVTVVMIHVDKVFAGMSANMAIIDEAVIISMDVTELDDDKYFGMDFDSSPETYIELEEEDGKSLSRGKTLQVIPDFMSIRVGDTESDEPVRFYVYNELQVGEVPGPKPTGAATEEPTGNVTVAPTIVGTTGPTETGKPTTNVTEKPTDKTPGFESVFAIAGLLAVAYLVLRKRE